MSRARACFPYTESGRAIRGLFLIRFPAMTRVIAHLTSARAAVARHRQNRLSRERVASTQSRYGLDWMNFFIADVQEGFGAFVAYYLADLKWSQGSIGEILTIGQAASALSMIPGGALTDVVHWKRC
jgi:hypothetical protein